MLPSSGGATGRNIHEALDARASNESGEDGTGQGAKRVTKGNGQLGWMTEARDWAGELISGQTMTGRILVSTLFFCIDPA